VIIELADSTLTGVQDKALAEIPKIYQIPGQDGYSIGSPFQVGDEWKIIITVFINEVQP
jgi:hypothetical protein